jgi:hypothetical protein
VSPFRNRVSRRPDDIPYRQLWKNLIAMLEQNSTLTDTAIIKNWIIRTYVDRRCSAIRRLNDYRKDTISFRQCLTDLIDERSWWHGADPSS